MTTIRAEITAAYSGKAYSTKSVSQVTDFFVDSAMDTDTDSWQITIGDFDRNLIGLLQRDSEVRCNFHLAGEGKLTALHAGIADEVAWNDEGVMVINGRDFTSVAVDSKHPPARYSGGRPHVIVAKEAGKIGIGSNMKLTPTNPFKQLATDGSESYWQFWYRLYRKRSMWMWAEPDGSIIGSTLNYNQKPSYYFGNNIGLGSKYSKFNFIPVERMEWRANKNSRVHEVYVIGYRGDKTGFVAKATDPSMKNWVKKRLVIINSPSAHGPGEARGEALEALFESKVGATEISLAIADPGVIIRQNRMCFVNIPTAGVRGEFYVVGTKIMGSIQSGFYQEVRLREKNYAISKRTPTDPVLSQGPGQEAMYGQQPMGGVGPVNPEGSIAGTISQTIGKPWGGYFVESTEKNRGPWPFSVFLGTLLAICEHETKFRNIRYNGFAGPDYPGTENGFPPKQSQTAAWNKFVSRYANEPKYGRIAAPPGYDQWAVGPMQLYTPSYKEYADRLMGPIDELVGGRWNPRYNIVAGGFALRSKLKGLEATLDGTAAQAYSLIWQGVTAYGGSGQYMREIKVIYDATYAPLVTAAAEAASALNKQGATVVIPTGNVAELISQILNNNKIGFSSAAARDDVKRGICTINLMKAMLSFANAGFQCTCGTIKTGHNYKTTTGSVSQHNFGKAVDMTNYRLGDDGHAAAQQWLVDNNKKLNIRQVIGPDDYKCFDYRVGTGDAGRAFYAGVTSTGRTTLQEHDNHIHLGVF